ncbi:leucine-rich repeat domain-containing protein [Larkinella sp. C7]|uniref:leucine-rich repeat domain-containing protein n=1 Tax=Larkinella sp. C7 TaxID=2576607 RepID=UPI001486DC79|nr:leucine-rich repeat domain-containing protein [Larkinella sp. C7]
MKIPDSFRSTGFETIAQLVDSIARRESVQAVRITSEVLRMGHGERLSGLNDLRVLYLEVDSATAFRGLWEAISQLKRLQRLTIVQVYSPAAVRVSTLTLPASLQQLTQLERLELHLWRSDLTQTFSTLAGMPKLRKLIFSGNGDMTPFPVELARVGQLTSVTIQSGKNLVQIPESLGELKKLKELNFNYLQLAPGVDWSILSKLTELETLRMSYTNLNALPDLRNLKKLKSVDVQGNPRLTIPEGTLEGLLTLENLNLSNCKLKQLPTALYQLSGLKELNLTNNALGELSAELANLKRLEVLQVSGCQLRKLPASLGELTSLRVLNLAGNQLDTLSFSLGKLTGITALSIYNNQLRFLPVSIGRLTALDRLDLSNNKLIQLPESIGDLSNLTELILMINQLTSLPAGIGKLSKLQQLMASENQLRQLPSEMGKLHRLKRLVLSSNKLTQLPETIAELDSLEGIVLNDNRFSTVPGVLFRLPSLQELNLLNNELTSVSSEVGKLTQLTYLGLSDNRLSGLPSELGKLTKLQILLLANNPLEVLPESLSQCRNLITFLATNTKLKALPQDIVRLDKLQTLDLSGNELTILPAALGNLSKLRSLRLGKTRLLALPESIGRLTQLTSLQVGEMQDISIAENTGLRQLPDSIVYCQELTELQLMNQTSLDGEDAFVKASKLRKLRNLTLFHSNVERLPEIDWKRFPVQQLSLMQNRLAELPVEMLNSPNLQRIALYENLLPQPLNTNFNSKDALRLAFSEAGLLALDKIAKPNRGIANSYLQMAFQKAGQRNWTEAFANFEKAIDYASDTMRVMLYAQRADMHVFRQEYAEAIADYDQSISLADRLTKSVSSQQPFQKQQFEQPAVLALRGRANAKARLGQIDAARADIEQALQRLAVIKGKPELTGNLLIEQGRYLTLKNKLTEANQSYRKALEEYEKMPYANTGIKLTVVELHLIVGQPDQARTALQKIDKRELQGGNAILEKYLESSIQVLKGEKPVAAILDDLKTYVISRSERIMGWSFELYENWLAMADLPAEKRTVLQQMTQLVKERVPKMD